MGVNCMQFKSPVHSPIDVQYVCSLPSFQSTQEILTRSSEMSQMNSNDTQTIDVATVS